LIQTQPHSIIGQMTQRFEEWDQELTLLRAASRDLTVAGVNLRHRVDVARRQGHSWAAIGVVLGITEQAAKDRFGQL
jgi:hypothetical protein